jgi:hypothetical protein
MRLAYERFETAGVEPRTGSFQAGESSNRGGVPQDLRDWLSEAELALLVNDAVQQVSRVEPTPGRTRTWDVLLGILTYFYATGSYALDEIENALGSNQSFAQAHTLTFGHTQPSAVLRRFRRANRRSIELCLGEVFQAVCRRLSENAELDLDRPLATDRLAAQEAASERVARAIECDSWTMDY